MKRKILFLLAVVSSLTIGCQSVKFDRQAYTWTVLAGKPGTPGSADGTGSVARFLRPCGVAVDNVGNLYVVNGDCTIRKVDSSGKVTMLAGCPGNCGNIDGTCSAARFDYPEGVAVDSDGNVYVADRVGSTIRKVTPLGVVMTIAGSAGSTGSADGIGSAARFNFPWGVAVDTAGNLYVADFGNHCIFKGTPSKR